MSYLLVSEVNSPFFHNNFTIKGYIYTKRLGKITIFQKKIDPQQR